MSTGRTHGAVRLHVHNVDSEYVNGTRTLYVGPLSFMLFCPLHPPQLSTLPPATATSTASKAINGASGDIAVAPVQTAELVGVEVSGSVGSAAGSVHPAYAGKL